MAAIENGKFPVTRKNYLFVKNKPNNLIKEFLMFALSDKGAKIVDEVGTSLPINKLERNIISQTVEKL